MKQTWTSSELRETILVVQALIWGSILLLPGDTFSVSSRIDFLSQYAPDHVWGALLLFCCFPFLLFNRYRYRAYRKFVHVFLWVFWLGIAAIAIWRSSYNGFAPTDFLIVIPFITIAFQHGVIYSGLEKDT